MERIFIFTIEYGIKAKIITQKNQPNKNNRMNEQITENNNSLVFLFCFHP